jgi:hypothetical protein
MSETRKYFFSVEEIIDGVDKYDFDILKGLKNPFSNINGVRTQISYACKWDPKTCWYTDCRPSFEAEGELTAGNLNEFLIKISDMFSGISLNRMRFERMDESTLETEYSYLDGDLSVTPRGKNLIKVPTNHPFYKNFCKWVGIYRGDKNGS